MKIVTVRDELRAVPAQWYNQYDHTIDFILKHPEDRSHDAEKLAIYRRLLALDWDTATAPDVAAVIGNNTWAKDTLICNNCGRECKTIARHEYEDDYGPAAVDFCLNCLQEAVRSLEAQPATE